MTLEQRNAYKEAILDMRKLPMREQKAMEAALMDEIVAKHANDPGGKDDISLLYGYMANRNDKYHDTYHESF